MTFVESKLQLANDNCMIQLYCHLVAAWHIVERLRPIRSPTSQPPWPFFVSVTINRFSEVAPFGSLTSNLWVRYVTNLIQNSWFLSMSYFEGPVYLESPLRGRQDVILQPSLWPCKLVKGPLSELRMMNMRKCPWRMIKLLWDLLESGETKTNPSNKYASPHWRLDCCGSSCLKHVAAWTETISCLTQSMTPEFLESKLDFW